MLEKVESEIAGSPKVDEAKIRKLNKQVISSQKDINEIYNNIIFPAMKKLIHIKKKPKLIMLEQGLFKDIINCQRDFIKEYLFGIGISAMPLGALSFFYDPNPLNLLGMGLAVPIVATMKTLNTVKRNLCVASPYSNNFYTSPINLNNAIEAISHEATHIINFQNKNIINKIISNFIRKEDIYSEGIPMYMEDKVREEIIKEHPNLGDKTYLLNGKRTIIKQSIEKLKKYFNNEEQNKVLKLTKKDYKTGKHHELGLKVTELLAYERGNKVPIEMIENTFTI